MDTSFTVPAGGTYQSIPLTITSDTMTENPEDLRVVLRNPSFGAVIENDIAIIYIVDVNCKLVRFWLSWLIKGMNFRVYYWCHS